MLELRDFYMLGKDSPLEDILERLQGKLDELLGNSEGFLSDNCILLTWVEPEAGVLFSITHQPFLPPTELHRLPQKEHQELAMLYLGPFWNSQEGRAKYDEICSGISQTIFEYLMEG